MTLAPKFEDSVGILKASTLFVACQSNLAGLGHALAFLYDFGFIHSDVKPGNIRHDRRYSTFVLDLGVVRRHVHPPHLWCNAHQKKKVVFAESAIKSTTGTASTSQIFLWFSSEPNLGKSDSGSLVHSRECGKAAAISVFSFEADLVGET